MGVPNSAIWEVRAAGSDSNGGGFDSTAGGTDYSQQDSAQYSGTNLVGIGSSAVTSASHSFVATDVGNTLNITSGSGFTPGIYFISSVGAGAATLDRDPGGSGTGGHYAVGGALLTIATAYAAAATHNTIWLKGTFTVTSTLTLSLNDSSVPFKFIGYTTTRGDRGRATWQTSTNSTDLVNVAAVTNYYFANILFQNTAGTPGDCIESGTGGQAAGFLFDNCRITGFHRGIWGPFSGNYYIDGLDLVNCEIDHCTSYPVYNQGETNFQFCWIHDNGDVTNVATVSGHTFTAFRSVWSTNTNGGIVSHLPFNSIVNCAFVNNTGDGLSVNNNAPDLLVLTNSIFYGNSGWGVIGGQVCPAFFRNNAFASNGSGASSIGLTDASNVTLTGNPFTNVSTGDFSLNSTAGAGAACVGAGFVSTVL